MKNICVCFKEYLFAIILQFNSTFSPIYAFDFRLLILEYCFKYILMLIISWNDPNFLSFMLLFLNLWTKLLQSSLWKSFSCYTYLWLLIICSWWNAIGQIVGAENPVLMSAAEQIFSAGGKRMRPALVFLVSRATAEIVGLE